MHQLSLWRTRWKGPEWPSVCSGHHSSLHSSLCPRDLGMKGEGTTSGRLYVSSSILMRLYNGPAVLTSHKEWQLLVANWLVNSTEFVAKNTGVDLSTQAARLGSNCGQYVALDKSIIFPLILLTYQLGIMTPYGFILRMKITMDGKPFAWCQIHNKQ